MTDLWFTRAFGAHYPLLYGHRDEAEAKRCLDLLPRLAPLDDRILDLGCGDGRHLQLLQERGKAAVGLDLSADLLERARERFSGDRPARLVRGDMRALPFTEGAFRSVLSLFTAFGYFGPPAANAAPVREIARVLEEGGHWFLDYFDADRVVMDLGRLSSAVRLREKKPLMVREERSYHPATSQVKKEVWLRPLPGQEEAAREWGVPREGLRYTEEVAVFTLAELDEMATAAGLVRTASAGGYEGQDLGEGSRWLLVYKKMKGKGRRT